MFNSKTDFSLKTKKSLVIELDLLQTPKKKFSHTKELEKRIRELERENLFLSNQCDKEKETRIKALRDCYHDKMKWRKEKFVLMQLNIKLEKIMEKICTKIINSKNNH